MIRLSSDQIDRGILNAAARTFARYGYARTSVQQLADAVGYSKTGLLHRFASKQNLYDAAVDATSEAVRTVLAAGAAAPAGGTRSLAVLEAVSEHALEDPGLVTMLLQAIRPASGEPGRERLHTAVEELVGVLCDGRSHDDMVRLRAVLALNLIVTAVATQDAKQLKVDRQHLQPLAVTLAAGVLGLDRPPPLPSSRPDRRTV